MADLPNIKNKVIITAAIVGAELTRKDTPYLPVTPYEIAEEAWRCCEAGASVIHLHARDASGKSSQKAEIYQEIISLIHTKYNPVIQVSTGGAIGMTTEERLDPVKLGPEMASLTLGSVNFGDGVFYNSPDMIAKFASKMKEMGVKPELEVFDAGMIDHAIRLVIAGLIETPLHFDFVLGVTGGLSASVKNLLFLTEMLPEGSTWSAAGIGRHQLPMAVSALVLGGHVRVGFEDNIYYTKGVLAKGNAPLVERVVRLAGELSREIATPQEARLILGLKRQ